MKGDFENGLETVVRSGGKMSNMIRFPAVQVKTGGLSRSTIYRLERNGVFQKRRVVTPRIVVWDENEIDGWIQSQNGGLADTASFREHERLI